MPLQSTYSRFWQVFTRAQQSCISEATARVFKSIDTGALTIGFDSTVITRSGKQQGSASDYNPNRSGRNSHPSLVAFISQTRMVANAWLRPGNTSAGSNCEAFMDETFEILRDHTVAPLGWYVQTTGSTRIKSSHPWKKDPSITSLLRKHTQSSKAVYMALSSEFRSAKAVESR